VLDAERRPVRGQVVNFRVVAGNGSVFAGSGSSNEDGLVQERWTLGPFSSDTQRVEARAVDPATGEPIVFAVFRAVTSPPDDVAPSGHLLIYSGIFGGLYEVVIGQPLPTLAYALARDWSDQPVGGLEVSFSVTGGGSVSVPVTQTGSNGVAFFDTWTIGPVPGLNRLIASAPGFRPDTLEVLGITRAAFELTPDSSDVAVGMTAQLVPARLDPAGDSIPDPPAEYRSLDPSVATVSAEGVVTGVATGHARIVGTSDEFADTVVVTVAMGFTDVSAGFRTTCAIGVDGVTRCWGSDESGQLGDGPGNSSGTRPVVVAGGLDFRQIRTSRSVNGFTCGLTTGGAAYCWGNNSTGQLGTAGPSSDAPQPVAGGLTFTTLEVGAEHACAIATGDKAYCWGGNSFGQLGTGDSTSRAQPTEVAGGLTFTELGAGFSHTCGVTGAGIAYCWGNGEEGQLGQGTTDGSPTPVAVTGGLTFATVSAGSRHSCGITTAGAAYCWGNNSWSQLGHGRFVFDKVLTPTAVAGGKTWIAVSAGSIITCGIATDGSAWCWGSSNDHGNLGNGHFDHGNHHPNPEAVVGDHRFSSISVGVGGTTCGVTTDPGTPLYCWGYFPVLVTGF
jgi:alpha-tubulin suppressor-like RCC1 family protein